MTTPYIRPEDVSEDNARLIIDFFNNAQNAEEIAETIEIPGELDVGLRVGQRILDRRDTLEGGFTTLAQIRAVPYVGPERFTEIVTVLTGMQPPAAASEADFQARVLRELETLRRMVAALQSEAGRPRCRVSLRATLPNAFVGQAVPVIVQVKDRVSGRPQPNQRLTVSADWGNLQTHVGYEARQGRAVTVFTNLKGQATLMFFPSTAEILTEAQQAALETALRELDAEAHAPLEIMPQLEHLVRRYQADSDKDLRAAIDIMFSERQAQLTQSVNPGRLRAAWHHIHAPIRAYVHEDGETTSVESMAVLNLGMKDWLPSWYAAFLDLSERENQLSAEIEAVSNQTDDSGELLDGILGNVYSYIGLQAGRVGEAVGQKIATQAVHHYMATGFETLDLTARQSLFPALNIASKSIRADTMGSLAVSTRIRREVKTDVATQLAPLGDVALFAERVDNVRGDLDQFQTDYGTFQNEYQDFGQDYNQFSTNYGQFTANYGQFTTNYGQFTTDYGQFNTDYRDFNTRHTNFDSRYTTFDANYRAFDTNYRTFDTNYRTFDTNYRTFVDRNDTFNTNLGNFNTRFNRFTSDYSRFRTDIGTRRPTR